MPCKKSEEKNAKKEEKMIFFCVKVVFFIQKEYNEESIKT